MSVGEFKANFAAVLERVKAGEKVGILYGRRKRPIAVLVPFKDESPGEKRHIGILEGKASAVFKPDFAMTEEDLLGL